MATSKELFTNLADELRDLTNTTDKMGLSKMAEHVAEANAEVDEQSAVVDELMAALQGKSVPGGDVSGGVEYEIITIPAGATSATYTLPRVTHAYGSVEPGYKRYEMETFERIALAIYGTRVFYIDDVWGYGYSPVRAGVDFEGDLVTYSAGIISWYSGSIDLPLTIMLVNDPSAPAIST